MLGILAQEDILQRSGLGTSSTFDLTAVGLPDAEVSGLKKRLTASSSRACLFTFAGWGPKLDDRENPGLWPEGKVLVGESV